MMEGLKYLEIIITFAVMLVGFGALWGKHTASVKAQHQKNLDQDASIRALHKKVENREDMMRDHIDSRFKSVDEKLDRILMNKF